MAGMFLRHGSLSRYNGGIRSMSRVLTSFNPATLFAGGAQGAFYNVTEGNAGTTNGNPVSTMLDSSGRGNNATSTLTARPTLVVSGGLVGLDFDGTNDFLSTSAFNWTTDEMTIILGIRKRSDAAAGIAVEFGPNINTTTGAFYMAAPESTGAAGDFSHTARGSAAVPAPISSGAILAPVTRVVTATTKIATPSRVLRVNGTQVAANATTMGTGNFSTQQLFIGSRAGTSVFLNGIIYGLIAINRLLTPAELAAAEQWMAAKSGVTIP